ncbi:hypothetical protein KAURM247S_05187 [Kitasatospora aureofaciens]
MARRGGECGGGILGADGGDDLDLPVPGGVAGEVGDGVLRDEGQQAVGPAFDDEEPPGAFVGGVVGGIDGPLRGGPGGGAGRRPGRGRQFAPGDRGVFDGEVEGEDGAPAEGALDGDGAAEQEGDLTADGQPEAGAAVLAAGGAVGLLEGAEDGLQVLGRDPDAGVGHAEGEHRAAAPYAVGQFRVGGGLDAQLDPAVFGELDGVGQQVAQHLAQAVVVGEEFAGDPGCRPYGEGEVLLPGQRAEGGLDVVEQGVQRHRVDVQVHLAGLDLGQVEDVVDELEQVGAGGVDDAGVLDLLGGQVPGGVLGEQLGQDEQAVERRAQLVAHVGQELRLVLRGQRQLVGALLQFLAGLLDLQVLGLDVAVLRGEQFGLVLQLGVGELQFLLPGLQFLGAGLEFGGQPLGLAEQLVGAGVGDDGVDVDADGLHQLVQEVPVDLGERLDGGQFDDAEDLVLDDDRQHQQGQRVCAADRRRRRGTRPGWCRR